MEASHLPLSGRRLGSDIATSPTFNSSLTLEINFWEGLDLLTFIWVSLAITNFHSRPRLR